MEPEATTASLQGQMRGVLLLALQAGLLASFYGKEPIWLVVMARTLRMASALALPEQLLQILATSQHCRVVHCALELQQANQALDCCWQVRENCEYTQLQQLMSTSLRADREELAEAFSYKVVAFIQLLIY